VSGAERLAELLKGPEIVVAPGVYDGLSARIATAAGFSAIYCSGGAVARGSGVPDLGLLTMTEVLVRLREVVDATLLPVIADADTGYGNPLNVVRAVREFERLGAAAIHLEDQVAPKKCGHYTGQELISAEEMVHKLRAALDTREKMLIIARTDARGHSGLEEGDPARPVVLGGGRRPRLRRGAALAPGDRGDRPLDPRPSPDQHVRGRADAFDPCGRACRARLPAGYHALRPAAGRDPRHAAGGRDPPQGRLLGRDR